MAKHSRPSVASQASTPRSSTAHTKPQGSVRPSVSSVRVGDLGASKPRARVGKSWAGRLVVLLLAIALLVGGAVFVYTTDVLSVEDVRVSGVRHLSMDEMSQLAAVPAGSTLLRIDTEEIAQRLKTNSWVEDAQVKLIFPHTVELDITERSIAAVVEVTSVEEQKVDSWAMAKDGMWLMRIPAAGSEEAVGVSTLIYEDASMVLHITDVPLDVHPEEGKLCADESVLNALAIVSGFTTTLADRVSVVSATDTVNTLLTLDNGVQIAFGTADDIRAKERVCLKLLEDYPDQIAYINVRVVERPTWRAVGMW